MQKAVKDVDTYIALQPQAVRTMLKKMREIIRSAAPKAGEVISYGMPMFKYQGMLAGFASAKNHLGFYPGAIVGQFAGELKAYKTSKGAIQFPYDKPLPVTLIKKIIKVKLVENKQRAQKKKKAK